MKVLINGLSRIGQIRLPGLDSWYSPMRLLKASGNVAEYHRRCTAWQLAFHKFPFISLFMKQQQEVECIKAELTIEKAEAQPFSSIVPTLSYCSRKTMMQYCSVGNMLIFKRVTYTYISLYIYVMHYDDRCWRLHSEERYKEGNNERWRQWQRTALSRR